MGSVAWLIVAIGISLFGPESTLVRRSGDAHVRMKWLLNETEDIRHMRSRYWINRIIDQPSHLTPDRVHGGIGP